MTAKNFHRPAILLLCCGLVLVQCTGLRERGELSEPGSLESNLLTPAQYYAGEVMSYMMQVVLGFEGDPANRKDWRARGLEEMPDFRRITEILTDPSRNKNSLIVYDANLFGLSEVLYHYDPAFNLFKGKRPFDSLYPSPELIAVRMLLQKKIHLGQTLHLKELLKREELLSDRNAPFSDNDLEAANLTEPEFKLLREVVLAEGHFKAYLKHPFLVDAMARIGAVEEDETVSRTIRKAGYGKYAGAFRKKRDSVVIALFPSVIKDFKYGGDYSGYYRFGFMPTEFYTAMTRQLMEQIMQYCESRFLGKMTEEEGFGMDASEAKRLWKERIRERIVIRNYDRRPLVLYPANAEKRIGEICPDCDFAVVILGKDVYLSMPVDPTRDVYPAANRIYMDIMDVQQSLIAGSLEKIGDFLMTRMNRHWSLDIGQ